MGHSALVLGTGGVGSVIGQKLHGYDEFEHIHLGDLDTVFAQQLHERTKRSRFQVHQLNAMDTARLAAFMREHKVEVTLNACPCQCNHSILEACAEARSHYIDMAADIYSPPGKLRPTKNSFEAEIEKFDHKFRDKDVTGVLCMGMDPGAVNVFARWAIDRLDTASTIRVLDADNAEVRGYRFAVLFNPETLFEELGAPPYYVKSGRVTSGRPLETEVEWVRFPDPIGLMKCYAVAHEEAVSLGTYPPFVAKGVQHSVFKYSLSDKVYHLSKSLQMLDLDKWKKVKVDGAEVSPIRVACANLPKPAQLGPTVDGYSCVGTEVRGTKDRKRVEYFIYTMDNHRTTYERWGYSLTEVQTGIPPALTARLLVNCKITDRGVMMPEAIDPEVFMENFSREGLEIFVERREVERL
ncbi:MAG TPA: saccharopine dehydrogenase C-terminal domain-containing protein [Tepidisphaeraceae bacterium]|nr:saccharopine dehydrogenase C-terminal domain-containing protein [Tepidisphaeraceae bacterium]